MQLTGLLFLFALQAGPDVDLAKALDAVNAIGNVDCSDPSANCPSKNSDSQYRLPLPVETDVRSAPDALSQDGSACAVIGQTICKTKPRPILRSNETPEETLNSAINPG